MLDLVTVLISKQSFFKHHVWPVYQGKSYLHGIALPDFYIVSPFFYKRSKQTRVPTFVWLFRDVATTAKGPGCDEGTNLRLRDFAVVPLMPTREYQSNKRFGFRSGPTTVMWNGTEIWFRVNFVTIFSYLYNQTHLFNHFAHLGE